MDANSGWNFGKRDLRTICEITGHRSCHVAKNCVPTRSAGRVLCPDLANICVSPRRKSLYDGRPLSKYYVSHHWWEPTSSKLRRRSIVTASITSDH